jgi:RNA polymerase sigma factor (sigma-70 family)
MHNANAKVFIVDDDGEMRKSLVGLVNSAGYQAEAYATASEFLSRHSHDAPSCVVLEAQLPDMNGLQIQEELSRQGSNLPIVFLSGHGSIAMSVRAIKAGAVNFFSKPCPHQELLAAIAEGIAQNREARLARAKTAELHRCFASLSPREREVLRHILAGRLNKQIAADLGTSEQTIKVHRGHLMTKLHVKSLIELAHLAEKASILPIVQA